jgi:hypothetical protein
MAQTRGGHQPGGGSRSRQVVSKPGRVGQPAERVHQGGAGQIGVAQGSHVMDRRKDSPYRGDPLLGSPRPVGGPGAVKLGNQVALNVGAGGPGKGRTLYGQSGSNQQYGSPAGNAPAKGREII